MHAHRVEVFDGADDDAVVGLVAHDLHFEFLPAEQRFLDEDFGNRREVHAALGEFVKFVAVVGDAAAGAAEGERGPDDEREPADLFRDGAGFVQRCAPCRKSGTSSPMESIRSLNTCRSSPFWMASALAPIISTPCRSSAPFLWRAMAVFKRGLAAERGQQHEFALRAEPFHFLLLAHDDFLDAFRRDGLDVGAVGELRVGHDGGRVGVDEDDAVALLLERLAGLRAGIIELARLADDDRAGADDEDAVNVSALGHLSICDLETVQNATDETRIRRGTKANCGSSLVWWGERPREPDLAREAL